MNFLTCTVRRCRYRHNRRLPKNVSLYMLPREAPEHLKDQWKEVCTGRLVACSEHFMDSDFIRRKTSPESRDKFKPLKQNVVPKINLLGKKIVQEAPGSSGKSENRKDEEIITLNDNPMKDPAQLTDPLADVPDDIVQEVQEPENTANAIDCQISKPPRRNVLNSIYDKVILKEDEKRIVRGPIEVRLEVKPPAPPAIEISSPNPDVVQRVVLEKPPPTKSPDGEKKGPKVVIRQVKLARKKFGDALARQKIINDMEVDRFLQRKDVEKPENVPESVKNLIKNDWTITSDKSHEESSENTKKSSDSSECLRKRRRKQVFCSDRDKLATFSGEDSKSPPEVREKSEEPPEKLPRTTEDDDDVIFLPQKIDVIDVEDDSDTEPSNQPTGSKCDNNSKISEDKKKISSLVALKEKLESRKKLLQTNNQKIHARHMATQEFLEAVPTVLSETQRDIMFGTSDPVVWQADEIRDALVLKNLSEDLYMYLRQVLNYPLPTLESLLVWELDYPQESIRAKTVAREHEQEAEDDIVEDDMDEEAEDVMLL